MSDLRAILRSTWLLAALGSVVAGIGDSCSGYAGFRPWFLSTGPRRLANTKMRVILRYTRVSATGSVVAGIRDSCSGYAGFRPWLLAGPPRPANTNSRVGSAGVLAALGSVVAGIRDSCSGCAGFRPWLLAAGPPHRRKMTHCHARETQKSRVDRRSTRVFVF